MPEAEVNADLNKAEGQGKKEETPEKHFLMYTIKCRCGDVLSRNMERCPGCGETIEKILAHIKKEFYRVNFCTPKPEKEK